MKKETANIRNTKLELMPILPTANFVRLRKSRMADFTFNFKTDHLHKH